MPEFVFGNVTVTGEKVTLQQAYDSWLSTQRFQLEDEEGRLPDDIDERLWNRVRALRDKLLADTDWMMLSDTPIEPAHMSRVEQYRQELRDVPQAYDKPEDVRLPMLDLTRG